MNSKIFLPILVLLLCGCPQRNSTPARRSTESIASLETEPSIRPLEEDAAILRKLLGYDKVIAYEFRGTWLKCWLECEIDGELVASTPEQVVSPKWFDRDAKVESDDAELVIGWITIWGESWDKLYLYLRGELPREDGKTSNPLTLQSSLKIPELPDEVLEKGTVKVGTTLQDEWMHRKRSLPNIANQPVALHWYSWTEKTRRDWSKVPDPSHSDPNQKVLREVKVTLYCEVPDERTSLAAVQSNETLERRAQ